MIEAARPLTIGEIFDRAVTIVARRWRAATLFSTLIALPPAFIGAVAGSKDALVGTLILAALVVSFVVGALCSAALVIVFADASATVGSAVAAARGRLWPELRSYAITTVALSTIGLVCAVPSFALGARLGSTLSGYEGSMLFGVPIAFVVAPVMLALSIAFPTTVLERVGASRGVSLAWSRVFRSGDTRRAWLLGAAVLVVAFGIDAVLDFAAEQAASALEAAWISRVASLVTAIGTLAYGTAVTTLAAIDYRVRTQGTDLEAALDPAT